MLNNSYAKKPIRRKMMERLWAAQVTGSMGILNEIVNRKIRVIVKALFLPIVILLGRYKNSLPYVEMDVTTRCTLNCKECCRLMPSYKSMGLAKDHDINELLGNVDLLHSLTKTIYKFRLLGGETFLNKQLYLIVNKLVSFKSVKKIQIVTNGTIIPTGENLTSLKHKKVSVAVSNYGDLSTKKYELFSKLKGEGIKVRWATADRKELPLMRWKKTDGVKLRGYSVAQMHQVFHDCMQWNCKSLLKGKLWRCTFAPSGASLGLLQDNDEDYIDLKNTHTQKEFFDKLRRLNDYPPEKDFACCYYCKLVRHEEDVPCAEQV